MSKNKFKGGREKDWLDDYLFRRDAFRDEVCLRRFMMRVIFIIHTLTYNYIHKQNLH